MKCPVMVQLIKNLDSVRAEQSTRYIDNPAQMRRLRAIENFIHLHEGTCTMCPKSNPLDIPVAEKSKYPRIWR